MKDERMISLTTRISVRDCIAVEQIAKREGVTESAWIRNLITNTVDVHTEPVSEDDIKIRISTERGTVRRKVGKKRRSFWERFLNVGG